VTLTVPAGSYAISSTSNIGNLDGDSQLGGCTLSTGATMEIRLDGFGEGHRGAVPLIDSATFAVPTTITLHCVTYDGYAADNTLMAIRVTTIN
jgi:hypothetical protein